MGNEQIRMFMGTNLHHKSSHGGVLILREWLEQWATNELYIKAVPLHEARAVANNISLNRGDFTA